MNAAENARLAYLGSNQAECAPWAELKPEIRERWDRVVRTVKQDAHYDDAATAEYVQELRAQLDAVMAERDAAQDDAAAIFDIASQDDADTPLEAVRKLKEYADTIEWREAHTESANNSLLEQLAALRQLTTATPTAAEVEALARVLRDAHWEHHGLSKQDDAAPGFYSACARAAYAHIVRVPVGCELDVTAEELAAKMWGFFDAEDMASKILDHCRSRIKPIYECKECAKLRDEVMFWKRENVAANNQMLSAIATLQAPRAALEGE